MTNVITLPTKEKSDDTPAALTESQKVAWALTLIADHSYKLTNTQIKAVARVAGFSGDVSFNRARNIVQFGVPELVAAVDEKRIKVSAGHMVLQLTMTDKVERWHPPFAPADLQRQRLAELLTPKQKPAGRRDGRKIKRSSPVRRIAMPWPEPAARGIDRFGPGLPGIAAKTYLTPEDAGLPAGATDAERVLFHQIHGMHPVETVVGRNLGETLRKLQTAVAGLTKMVSEMPTGEQINQVTDWGIDLLLTHVPRHDVGHGEERDYAKMAREQLNMLNTVLGHLRERLCCYQTIIDTYGRGD